MSIYYLEYRIINNRPGLLGDVASLLGLTKINIKTIASIEDGYRGLLVDIKSKKIINVLSDYLSTLKDLELITIRKPTLFDDLALKHGKKIKVDKDNNCCFFKREDLELLIDFLGGYIIDNPRSLIGLMGNPRIGKTETAIAAAIHAKKRWQLISSTLIRKVIRTKISEELLNEDSVFIIDAATTFYRATSDHIDLVKRIIKMPLPRIVEHPNVLVREMNLSWTNFNLLIALIDENNPSLDLGSFVHSFNSFDIG